MPASSVRDLIVKNDDIVAATHGRGFWILDDISPLRQLDSSVDDDAVLFKPQDAYRVRWNITTDTPLPPDEPTGTNPPEGAIINFFLKTEATDSISLEILHENGESVRRYSSADPVFKPDPATASVPLYWYRPALVLQGSPGMHRFVWDMHYQPLDGIGLTEQLPIAAVGYNTVSSPTTPRVAPGNYVVLLTVNGKTYTQPLTIVLDPRVKTIQSDLDDIFGQSREMYYSVVEARKAIQQANDMHEQIDELELRASGPVKTALTEFDKKILSLRGEVLASTGRRRARASGPIPMTLEGASAATGRIMNSLQRADVAPTKAQRDALIKPRQALTKMMADWNKLASTELDALNRKLATADLSPVKRR